MKKQLRAIAAFWHREYGRFFGITALAFLALTVLAYIVGRLVPNVPVTIIRTFNESIADAATMAVSARWPCSATTFGLW